MMDIITNKKQSAVIFDLDGTLIDISKRDYCVYQNILTKSGFIALDFNNYWILRRNKISIFTILEQTNVPSTFFDYFITKRKEVIDSKQMLYMDTLFPYAKEIIEWLKKKYSCYLVTSRNNKKNTKQQLCWLGLNDIFSDTNIFITDRTNKREIFEKINEIEFVIGDTENDIIPAKELKKITIAVCSGIRSEKYLKLLSPTYIISDISELKNLPFLQ